ncbi:murein DD-endopeptidase MepM/ murein hydrolase activator NlpD, partial [Arthrobacter sp. CAN_A214]|uniref:M23 family metallopeptidase n=1 Tax=Arthrobacter sp. CAN_A214 TaxID=2787720 RepID=UPI0018C99A46
MTKFWPFTGTRKAAWNSRVAARSGLGVFIVLAAVSTSGYQSPGSTPQLHSVGSASTGANARSGIDKAPSSDLAGRGLLAPRGTLAGASDPTNPFGEDSEPPKATPTENRFEIVRARDAHTLLANSSTEFLQVERPAAGTLVAPLRQLNPSSSFGLRTNPLDGSPGEFHWGLDFAASCGTTVFSADAGVVTSVGWHAGGGGNRIELDHGNGLVTTYNHLESISVKKGDAVNVSTAIAKVGTTGSSTGCHLHFETILDGTYADPENWRLVPVGEQNYRPGPVVADYAPGFAPRPELVPVLAPVFNNRFDNPAVRRPAPPAEVVQAGPLSPMPAPRPTTLKDLTPPQAPSFEEKRNPGSLSATAPSPLQKPVFAPKPSESPASPFSPSTPDAQKPSSPSTPAAQKPSSPSTPAAQKPSSPST